MKQVIKPLWMWASETNRSLNPELVTWSMFLILKLFASEISFSLTPKMQRIVGFIPLFILNKKSVYI